MSPNSKILSEVLVWAFLTHFKSLIGFVRLSLFSFQICLFLTHLLNGAESRIYLQVEELLIEGKELADNNQFSQSLRIFNQALGLLKQTPRSHPLRMEAEKWMKITKGRFLVARYKGSKVQAFSDPDALRPLSEESREFKVLQVFGKSIARKIWEPRDDIRTGEILGLGRRVTTLPDGGIELASSGTAEFSLRTVQASSFDLLGKSEFALHSGSYVIHSKIENSSIILDSPTVEVKLSSDDPFAFMAGVTTNGGLKIICLLGEIKLRTVGKNIELLPGELSFALSDGFSRKMNVELSTLLVTSNLLTGFNQPPVFLKKLRQQAMLQALRTRKRFRTVVGDVKGTDNFELRVLKEGIQ